MPARSTGSGSGTGFGFISRATGCRVHSCISVIRITTPGTESSATPLFLLAGGPGQAGSDILGAFSDETRGSYASWTPLLEDRDTYVIDQRGTGRTEPAVVCPADRVDPSPAVGQSEIAAPVDDEARAATAADYYGDCADALLDEGIDLETYNNR
jgi:pimeloyl-ACP methyl ester carboxylesterase